MLANLTRLIRAAPCPTALAGGVLALVVAAPIALAGGEEPSKCFELPQPSLDFETADLDGDGLTDLALFESETGRVRVLRNQAGGGFVPADDLRIHVPFDLPPGHATIRAVDVDADGILDLVGGGYALQFLAVAFGEGNAAYADFVEFALTNVGHARGFVAGDFDGDALVELVIVGARPRQLLAAEGRRDRKLEDARLIPTSVDYPHFLATGDLSGDGRADIVVWGRAEPAPHLSVLEGDGAGGFEEATVRQESLDPGEGPIGPRTGVVADFDGDGALEIVVIVADPGGDAIRVRRGGDGTYAADNLGLSIGTGPGLPSIAAGDWNADGRQDLVALAADGWAVSLFANTGGQAPLFQAACKVSLPAHTAVLAAGELGGMRGGDLIAEHSLESRLQVLYGPFGRCGAVIPCTAGDALACYASVPPHPTPSPERVLIVDVDGDGRGEAVAAGDGGALVLAPGSGRVIERASVPLPAAAEGLDAADVDADGILDLAVADFAAGTAVIALFDRLLEPRLSSLSAGLLPADVCLEDLDGDRTTDLAVPLFGEGKVALFLGRGQGQFAEPTFHPAGAKPRSIVAGDLDGDGTRDLAVANEGNGVSLLFGRGGGAFAEPAPVRAPADPGAMVVANLEADGFEEVLVASRTDPAVTIILQDSGALRWRTLELPAGTLATAVRHADMDGDGLGDLITADSVLRRILIQSGQSSGQFATIPQALVLPADDSGKALALATGDLDGDGFIDLVVGDAGLKQVHWLRSRGCGRSSPFRRGDVDGDARSVITDPVLILNHLFLGAGALACADAADTDDDGKLTLSDPVALLIHLFQGGPPPSPPASACGPDPTADTLGSCDGGEWGRCG